VRFSLEQISIASPCDMQWDDLTPIGEREAVRRCARCSLNVYDLSAMTAAEIERMVRGADGRVCARLRRRADGTVLTRDCPIGLRAVRQQAIGVVVRAAGAVLVLLSAATMIGGRLAGVSRPRLGSVEPVASIGRWVNPAAVVPQYDAVGSIDLQAVLDAGQGSGGRSPFADDE
jgi:hypothetical protein